MSRRGSAGCSQQRQAHHDGASHTCGGDPAHGVHTRKPCSLSRGDSGTKQRYFGMADKATGGKGVFTHRMSQHTGHQKARVAVSPNPPRVRPGPWQLADALAGSMVDAGEDRGHAPPGERKPARGGEGGIRHAPGRHFVKRTNQRARFKSESPDFPPDLGGEVRRSPRRDRHSTPGRQQIPAWPEQVCGPTGV
jgi:hypothetical protein